MPEMKKAISFGAGVNSIAMTIMLFKRGEIYPVVFADTMAEHPETYCYMDYFEKEFMSKYGQKIIRISPMTHPELYPNWVKGRGLEEYCLEAKVIPFHFQRFCTVNWKVIPLKKFIGDNQIIGFAYDEKHRAESKPYTFPLIDERITRQGCYEIIKQEELPRLLKSGCYFCPFQRIKDWERLWEKNHDLFEKACKLEENAGKDGKRHTFNSTDISLRQIEERFKSKGENLFPDWDFEELEPCMCKL